MRERIPKTFWRWLVMKLKIVFRICKGKPAAAWLSTGILLNECGDVLRGRRGEPFAARG